MDTDPTRETTAPRHAVESDDEEDESNPLPSGVSSSASDSKNLNIQIKGPSQASQLGGALVVACGDAGIVWARGADLGEQQGSVFVNEYQVGLVFKPSWTNTTVLVSEVTTSLPVWAMNPYAKTIIDFFKPMNVVLLDTYSCSTYITDAPVPFHEAPVRYLRTNGNTPPAPDYKPFSPPNLIQSTSASFLSLMSMSKNAAASPPSPRTEATLLLLPSPRIAPPRPSKLTKPDLSSINNEDLSWPTDVMQELHHTAFCLVGDKSTPEWKPSDVKSQGQGSNNQSGDVGEGSMYI